jgi:sec-independent protein translocase protein TatB
MFDIGFWELVLVGIIALVVLGPERLPGAARTLGLWTARARSYLRNFTSELEREVGAQEIARHAREARQQMTELNPLAEPSKPAPSATDEKAPRDE